MPIDVSCPKCGAGLPVPDEFAGRTVRCGGCEELIPVPGLMPPPLPGAEQPPPLPLPQARPVARPVARAVPVSAEPAQAEPKSEPFPFSKSVFGGGTKHERAKPQTKTALFVVAGLILFGCCGISIVGYAFVQLTQRVADAGGKNPFPPVSMESKPPPPVIPTPPVANPPTTKNRTPTPTFTTDRAAPKAPSPQGMKGLQLYVSFNADPIREDNSRRALPVEGKPYFREGANRNAARLVAIPNRDGGEPKFACDLTAFVNSLRFKEDAPFTIALWVQGGVTDAIAFAATQASLELSPRLFVRADMRSLSVELFCDETDSEKKFVRTVAQDVRDMNAFHHIALTRDAGGTLTVFYDGTPIANAPVGSLPAKQPGELKFRFAGFGLRAEKQISTVELDEFCVFERALSADEIMTLAGKGKKDKE